MIAPRLGNAPISSASTGTWPASTIALTEAACSARKSSCPALIGSTSASYFAVSAAASDGGSSPTCRTVVAIANSFVGTGSSGYGPHNNSPVDGSRQVVDGVRTHLRRLEIPGHPIRDVHVCVAAHREVIVVGVGHDVVADLVVGDVVLELGECRDRVYAQEAADCHHWSAGRQLQGGGRR